MSDEKPSAPPVSPPPAVETPEPVELTRKPDRVALLREKQAVTPKPLEKAPPSLEREMTYGSGKKIDAFDAEMERELEEAMTGFAGKELLVDQPRGRNQQPEGPKKAKVYRIHGPNVFLELPGGRTQGVLLLADFPEGPPAPGTEIEITIEGVDDDGLLRLSRKGAAVQADWSTVAVGQVVEVRVKESNKGGLAVEVNGIRGFMPISQIDLYRVDDLAPFVNQKLLCMITEVDVQDRNLVVSRRALLEKEREEQREKVWAELAEGQVREGIVRSIREFGAFVDIGGVDGLVHVSDLSWTRVKNPEDAVKVGQKVKVVVLKIDHEKRKVGLGMKQLQASPWDDIVDRYPQGTTVTGTVTRTTDFGAFVELEQAIEGLIHISELAPQRVWRVSDVVKVGQEVEVKVLTVDPEQRRISLSLKAALAMKTPTPTVPEEEDDTPEPTKQVKPRTFQLRGGTGGGGPLFPTPPEA